MLQDLRVKHLEPDMPVTAGNLDEMLRGWIKESLFKIIVGGLAGVMAVGGIVYLVMYNSIRAGLGTESLMGEVKKVEGDARSANESLRRANALLAPVDELLDKHDVNEIERAVASVDVMLKGTAVSFPGDVEARQNQHGEELATPVLKAKAHEVREGKCPDGSFVVGIALTFAGTCNEQCAGDAPVIKGVQLRCAKI